MSETVLDAAEPQAAVPIEVEVAVAGGAPPPAPAAPTSGSAAAALVASGVGCSAFGAAVVAAEANEGVHHALTLSDAVGPLSGKGVAGTSVWLLAWGALHLRLRRREVPLGPYLRLTAVLVAAGFVLTFPPVYTAFAR